MSERIIDGVADTARWVAYYRAIESERRDALFRDPYARRLAGERGQRIARSLPAGPLRWVIAVRTAVFDELIQDLVHRGAVDTVLNLAAGLDTRPYRLTLPPTLRWVEVDLPEMIAYKEPLLAAERPVCRVERVSLDLANTAGRRALLSKVAAGARAVLVVTEGLLEYLEATAVSALAADLRDVSAIHYWLTQVSTPPVLAKQPAAWKRALAEANALMKFAPPEGTAFFKQRGWQEHTARSMMLEAQRLRREMPGAWLMRKLWALHPPTQAMVRDVSRYVVFAPGERPSHAAGDDTRPMART